MIHLIFLLYVSSSALSLPLLAIGQSIVDQGPYESEYILQCSGVASLDEYRMICQGVGEGYDIATLPTVASSVAAYNLFASSAYGTAWIGLSDAETEGTWKFVAGRLKGLTYSILDTCAASKYDPLSTSSTTFNYCYWNTGEPNDAGGNEDCVQYFFSGTTPLLNDIPCAGVASAMACGICERSPCKMGADCHPTNTQSIVGSYFPNCECVCKSDYWGDKCENSVVDNGPYVSHYMSMCSATYYTYATAHAACQAQGEGWDLATTPTLAAQNAAGAIAVTNGLAWVGITDDETEGTWRYIAGRLKGLTYSILASCVSSTYTPIANLASTTFYNCLWNAGEPNDGASDTATENCGEVIAFADGRLNDAPCDYTGILCAVCERSPCKLGTDCHASNTESMTGSYFPNCVCTCKPNYWGAKCEYLSEVDNGPYVSYYSPVCSATPYYTFATVRVACQALGEGWDIATTPTPAAQNAAGGIALIVGTSWLGVSDKATEGTWRYSAGRLEGLTYSILNTCVSSTYTPIANLSSTPFYNCLWNTGEPNNGNGVGTEDCGQVIPIADGRLNDAPCDFIGMPCGICERSPCKLGTDCHASNTESMTGSYFPNCVCTCNPGFHGEKCEKISTPTQSRSITSSPDRNKTLSAVLTYSLSAVSSETLSFRPTISNTEQQSASSLHSRTYSDAPTNTIQQSRSATNAQTHSKAYSASVPTPSQSANSSASASQMPTATDSALLTSSVAVSSTADKLFTGSIPTSASASAFASQSIPNLASETILPTQTSLIRTATPSRQPTYSISLSQYDTQSHALPRTRSPGEGETLLDARTNSSTLTFQPTKSTTTTRRTSSPGSSVSMSRYYDTQSNPDTQSHPLPRSSSPGESAENFQSTLTLTAISTPRTESTRRASRSEARATEEEGASSSPRPTVSPLLQFPIKPTNSYSIAIQLSQSQKVRTSNTKTNSANERDIYIRSITATTGFEDVATPVTTATTATSASGTSHTVSAPSGTGSTSTQLVSDDTQGPASEQTSELISSTHPAIGATTVVPCTPASSSSSLKFDTVQMATASSFDNGTTVVTCHTNYAGQRPEGLRLGGQLLVNFAGGGSELLNATFEWLNLSCLALAVPPITTNVSSITFRVADPFALGYCAGPDLSTPVTILVITSIGGSAARGGNEADSIATRLAKSSFGIALFDLQVLGLASRSQCAPPPLQSTFGHLRLVAPLAFWEDEEGGLVGTLFVLAAAGLCFLAAGALVQRKPSVTAGEHYGSSRRLVVGLARVYSGLWIHLMLAVLPGLLFVSVTIAFNNKTRLATLGGLTSVFFALLLAAAPALCALFVNRSAIPAPSAQGSSRITRWFCPSVAVLPRSSRLLFGALTAWRQPMAFWSSYPLVAPTVLGVATASVGPSSSCAALYGSLAGLCVVLAVITCVLRPFRTVIESTLGCLSMILASAQLVVCAVMSSSNTTSTTTEPQVLKTALTVLFAIHAAVVLVCRIAIPVWLHIWEDELAARYGAFPTERETGGAQLGLSAYPSFFGWTTEHTLKLSNPAASVEGAIGLSRISHFRELSDDKPNADDTDADAGDAYRPHDCLYAEPIIMDSPGDASHGDLYKNIHDEEVELEVMLAEIPRPQTVEDTERSDEASESFSQPEEDSLTDGQRLENYSDSEDELY